MRPNDTGCHLVGPDHDRAKLRILSDDVHGPSPGLSTSGRDTDVLHSKRLDGSSQDPGPWTGSTPHATIHIRYIILSG